MDVHGEAYNAVVVLLHNRVVVDILPVVLIPVVEEVGTDSIHLVV